MLNSVELPVSSEKAQPYMAQNYSEGLKMMENEVGGVMFKYAHFKNFKEILKMAS